MDASDRKGRFPGHLRAVGGLRVAGLALLLARYDGYQPFLSAAADAHAKQQQLLTIRSPSDRRNALRTLNHRFAARWNLHHIAVLRENDYAAVDTAIAQTGTVFKDKKKRWRRVGRPFYPSSVVLAIAPPPEPVMVIAGVRYRWRLSAGESLGRWRARIAAGRGVRRGSDLPARLQRELRAAPRRATRAAGWLLTDDRHGLDEHVRWLFWRLCPQPNHPWSGEQIAGCVGLPDSGAAVRSKLRRTAALLDVRLPPVRGGRPRGARAAHRGPPRH